MNDVEYSCVIYYKDMNWNDCKMELDGDLSELLQHECDHLYGVLATMRAVDNMSIFMAKAGAKNKNN